MRAIEEVLRDYAQPFVAVGWGSQTALDTAAAIWDMVIDGMSNPQIVAALDENADPHVEKLVAAFVQRKQQLFAADLRYAVGSRLKRA